MITITPNSQNTITIPKELFDNVNSNLRIRFYRQLPDVDKTTYINIYNEYHTYWQLKFIEVPSNMENLLMGQICLQDNPGEWVAEMETSSDNLVWTSIYRELCNLPIE